MNLPPCVPDAGFLMYSLLSFKTAEATCKSQGTAGMLVLLCVLVLGSEELAYIQQVNSWKSTNALEGLTVWNFTDRRNGTVEKGTAVVLELGPTLYRGVNDLCHGPLSPIALLYWFQAQSQFLFLCCHIYSKFHKLHQLTTLTAGGLHDHSKSILSKYQNVYKETVELHIIEQLLAVEHLIRILMYIAKKPLGLGIDTTN